MTPRAELDFQTFFYVIRCDVEGDINLTIDGKLYPISAKNFVIQIGSDVCILGFQPTFGSSYGPEWILGGPFLREYCNVHDVGKKQIGFAKSKQ
ncbi:hypothetical protein OESDEN_23940 [Oesophagostomum dentatum]|uniref:Peptidase A1 domain-containing protein n=1 Tax=Oesophagostomum dentatum TaxID=61180 RepID=A0A0B1RZN2_OESDE|nr:hypothetical protein OESDEN_23940 [Oesophagostomum dentatum]